MRLSYFLTILHFILQLVECINSAKPGIKYHYVGSVIDFPLSPELVSTLVKEFTIGVIPSLNGKEVVQKTLWLECAIKCLGLTECLMFGLNDGTIGAQRKCVVWLPQTEGAMNISNSFPTTGLYIKSLPETPTDCADLQNAGLHDNGPFWVFLNNVQWAQVYCDFHTDGGGWTKRHLGTVNFHVKWATYKAGFGNLMTDFWLGNDYLNLLTTQKAYELRIDIWDINGKSVFSNYESMSVADENAKYKLTLGTYGAGSTAGDALGYHNTMKFTTIDRDNDGWGNNCAISYKGGWWFKACDWSNLNGKWNITNSNQNSRWKRWKRQSTSLRSEMKVRPKTWRALLK